MLAKETRHRARYRATRSVDINFGDLEAVETAIANMVAWRDILKAEIEQGVAAHHAAVIAPRAKKSDA